MKKEEVNYDILKEVSDEFYEKLELDQYIVNMDNNEFSIIARDNLFYIILKLYSSIRYDIKISFTIQEIRFILDFKIYKHMQEIIKRLQKINK